MYYYIFVRYRLEVTHDILCPYPCFYFIEHPNVLIFVGLYGLVQLVFQELWASILGITPTGTYKSSEAVMYIDMGPYKVNIFALVLASSHFSSDQMHLDVVSFRHTFS